MVNIKTFNFPKAALIAVAGHIVIISLFGISFENKSFYNYNIVYWGKLFSNSGLSIPLQRTAQNMKLKPLEIKDFISPAVTKEFSVKPSIYQLKPLFLVSNSSEKTIGAIPVIFSLRTIHKKDSVIMFHPVLPAHFSLYFKDRQVVNLELQWKYLIYSNVNSSIIMKRKISSGNLEADLLSMRYINRYLLMQYPKSNANLWNTIKIELSIPKNN